MELYRKAGATLVPYELPELPAAAIYAMLNAEAGAMFDELVRTGRINELADKGPNGRANQLAGLALHSGRRIHSGATSAHAVDQGERPLRHRGCLFSPPRTATA